MEAATASASTLRLVTGGTLSYRIPTGTHTVSDQRNPDLIERPMQSLIAQRVYALCCGYEDLNDHDRLRDDSILQTALGRDELLGSSPESMPLELSGTSCPATITLLRGCRSSQPLRSRLSRYICIA